MKPEEIQAEIQAVRQEKALVGKVSLRGKK